MSAFNTRVSGSSVRFRSLNPFYFVKLVGLLVLLSCGSAGGEQVRGRKDGSMHPKEASLGERRVQEDLDNMLVEDIMTNAHSMSISLSMSTSLDVNLRGGSNGNEADGEMGIRLQLGSGHGHTSPRHRRPAGGHIIQILSGLALDAIGAPPIGVGAGGIGTRLRKKGGLLKRLKAAKGRPVVKLVKTAGQEDRRRHQRRQTRGLKRN